MQGIGSLANAAIWGGDFINNHLRRCNFCSGRSLGGLSDRFGRQSGILLIVAGQSWPSDYVIMALAGYDLCLLLIRTLDRRDHGRDPFDIRQRLYGRYFRTGRQICQLWAARGRLWHRALCLGPLIGGAFGRIRHPRTILCRRRLSRCG